MNKLVLYLIFFFPDIAYAYIDPGTGSFILQAILALFATIGVFFSYQLKIVKSFFEKLFKKKKEINKQK